MVLMILTTSDRFLSLPCAPPDTPPVLPRCAPGARPVLPGYLLTLHKVPTKSTRRTSTITC